MEQSQKVLQCFYCGNKTLMNKVGEYKFEDNADNIDFYRKSRMYFCPICYKITFTEEEYCSLDCNPWDDSYPYENIVFPINSFSNRHNIPINIIEAFEASLKAKNIDNAVCLMALRRTLELVCKDKNAQGRNLDQKIKSLSDSNILPPALIEVSTITRLFGNLGAHEFNEDISVHDINQVAEFVEYILDYLYVLPAKIKSLQKKLINIDNNVKTQ